MSKETMARITVRLALLALLGLLGACSPAGSKDGSQGTKRLSPHQVRIAPTSLFNESTRLLEPHLGLTTGAVEIEYPGPKTWISYGYEIWSNGEVVKPVSWAGCGISSPYSGTISISLKDPGEDTGEPKFRVVVARMDSEGYSCSPAYVPMFESRNGASGSRCLRGPIVCSDAKEVAVWGYFAGEVTASMGTHLTILEAAKHAEWGIVLKVRLGEEPGAR